MRLDYLISTFCGVLLTILVLAFVGLQKFRRDCLAKEGDVQVLKFFSVHGAVVLSLFALFIFGLIYPITYYEELASNTELEKRVKNLESEKQALEDQIAALTKKGEKKVWQVKVPLKRPEGAPQEFSLRNGMFTVRPASFNVNKRDCTANEATCVFSMTIETEPDQSFEDGIRLISYDNGTYFANINPKQSLEDYKAGRKDLFTEAPDGETRTYGKVQIWDASDGVRQ